MATPTLIQTASGTNGTAAFGSNVTAGDLLIVFTNLSSSVYTPTSFPVSAVPSDTQGNQYIFVQGILGPFAPSFEYVNAGVWFAIAKTTGANTVSFTSQGWDGVVAAAEYSASSIDVASVVAAAATANPAQSPAVSTSFADELLVGWGMSVEPLNLSGANSPFSFDLSVGSGVLVLEHAAVASLGSYQSDFVVSRAADYITGLFTLSSASFASISGNCAVAGATVLLTGALNLSTTADGSGNFSFATVINGNYVVTVYANGNAVSPNSQNVTVSNSTSMTGVNFTAAGTIPSLIQSVQGLADNNSPYYVAYTSPITKGDFLLAVLWYDDSLADTPGLSDSQGNEWTLLTSSLAGDSAKSSGWVWYTTAKASGTNTLEFSGARIGVGHISIAEFSPAVINAFSAALANKALNIQSSAITAAANSLLIGWATSDEEGCILASVFPYNQVGASGAFADETFTLLQLMTTSASGSFQSSFVSNSQNFSSGGLGYWVSGIIALSSLFSVSGNVGVGAATISYSGSASGSVTADGSGNYSIPGLPSGASITITPSATGYTFSPTSQSETISTSNITGVNFSQTQLQVATTTFSPASGSYSPNQEITLENVDSGLAGFAMYWNTTGNPTTSSNLYTGPITLTASETIYVLAVATDYLNSAIASAPYVIVAPLTGSGFAPSWLFGQLNEGLGIYVSPGSVNGIRVNGQVVPVPPDSTTYVWATASGVIATGSSLPTNVFPIAVVVSGEVQTGTENLPNNLSEGVQSIVDIRQ